MAGVAALAIAGFLITTDPSAFHFSGLGPSAEQAAPAKGDLQNISAVQPMAATGMMQPEAMRASTATSPPAALKTAASQPNRAHEPLPHGPAKDPPPTAATVPSRTAPTSISPLVPPARQAAPVPQEKIKPGPVEANGDATGRPMRPVMRPPPKEPRSRLAQFDSPTPRLQPPPRMQW
jgi:hypothetical protein